MSDGLDDAADTAAEHVAASAADPSTRAAKARPSRKATLRPDVEEGRCANCNTELQGPVCHHCGQLADEFHRPVRGLAGEIIEGLVALDGRVARTIPNLLLFPGRVTRAYLKGQRARFMPPFRLYIIASLLFFLLVPLVLSTVDGPDPQVMGDAIADGVNIEERLEEAAAAGELTPEQLEEARAALQDAGLGGLLGPEDSVASTPGDNAPPADAVAPSVTDQETPEADTDGLNLDLGLTRGDGTSANVPISGEDSEDVGDAVRRYLVPEDFGEEAPEGAWPYSVRSFLSDRFARVAEDPAAWIDEAVSWIPRIMFAMVPVYALLLSLTYAWRRGFFLYDHLIVSVHFHAALFLAMTIFYLLGQVLPGGLMVLGIMIYSNFYLYRLNRVVYERGRFSSVVRTLFLDFVYGIILSIGMFATFLISALVG